MKNFKKKRGRINLTNWAQYRKQVSWQSFYLQRGTRHRVTLFYMSFFFLGKGFCRGGGLSEGSRSKGWKRLGGWEGMAIAVLISMPCMMSSNFFLGSRVQNGWKPLSGGWGCIGVGGGGGVPERGCRAGCCQQVGHGNNSAKSHTLSDVINLVWCHVKGWGPERGCSAGRGKGPSHNGTQSQHCMSSFFLILAGGCVWVGPERGCSYRWLSPIHGLAIEDLNSSLVRQSSFFLGWGLSLAIERFHVTPCCPPTWRLL